MNQHQDAISANFVTSHIGIHEGHTYVTADRQSGGSLPSKRPAADFSTMLDAYSGPKWSKLPKCDDVM